MTTQLVASTGQWRKYGPLCLGGCGAPVPPGSVACTTCTARLPDSYHHAPAAAQIVIAVAYFRVHGGD